MLTTEVQLDFSAGQPANLFSPTETRLSIVANPHKSIELSATEACLLMRNGHMTVAQYISSLLLHIRERDPLVRAWVYLDEKAAMSQALSLDQLLPSERGPLHGVAVGIKDIIEVKDMPTRYGCRLHARDGSSPTDAAVVSILRSAGAVILGKTATTELAAVSEGGPCANPRDLRRTPGGSSSGSAAAVADRQCPISVGTQTGGSIIRPGSFTGAFALKPTWGLLSTEGVGRFSISCDTLGLYARNMDDLALLSQLFHLEEGSKATFPRTMQPFECKVAMIKSLKWSEAGPGTQQAWLQAERILKQASVAISHINLPEVFNRCYSWRQTIVASEAKAAFLPRYVRGRESLHPFIQHFVESNKPSTSQELREAYDGIGQLQAQWDMFAGEYDFVLTPSAPDEAPLGLDYTGSSAFCSMWTILRVPALNVPGFVGEHGMPIGLTVTGRRYADASVLEAGRFLERLFRSRK